MAAKHRFILYETCDRDVTTTDNLQTQLLEFIKDKNIDLEIITNSDKEEHRDIMTTLLIKLDARQYTNQIVENAFDQSELLKIMSATGPAGSVLLVMYMDEFSKQLEDDNIVADEWSGLWKDETFEFQLHRKNRCFTVWDKFNTKQLQTILRYLTTLQFVHLTEESHDVLYIGTKQNADEFHRHLLANPFLEQLEFTEGHSNVSVSEYRHYLSYLYRKENKFTLWTINLPLFNFCCGDDLQARIPKLKQDVLANDLRNSMQPLQQLQRFDLVIIHCHCDTCFLHLYRDSYQLKSEIAGVLGCLELQVQSRNITPFISEQYAESVNTTVRDIVTKMFDECPGSVGYEDTSLTVLSGLPMSIVLNLYSWHLCLTPTGRCHKQSIDSDGVECIVPRKVKYITFGFAFSVVILVIVLVITSL